MSNGCQMHMAKRATRQECPTRCTRPRRRRCSSIGAKKDPGTCPQSATDFRPIDMRQAAAPEITEGNFCKRNVGYAVTQPEDRPEELRGLTEDIVDTLRPLHADPGPGERAARGYGVHTSMTRLVWSPTSVKEKIAELPTRQTKDAARRARRFLLVCEDSSKRHFHWKHTAFLARQGGQQRPQRRRGYLVR